MNKDNTEYNILAIEDNLGDYVLMEEYITEYMAKASLIRAKSFKEAEEHLIENREKIQVIFLDLTLPDRNGEDLVKDMVKLAKELPIIVLTGYTNISFAIKALSLGVNDYLVKDELSPSILYKSIVYNIERKKNLERLKESEKRYSELFHLSPEPMWVYDSQTFEFLDVNDATVVQYGYSLEEFKKMTIFDIRPQSELQSLKNTFEAIKKDPNTYLKGTYTHQRKDGSIIHVEICANTLMFNNRQARLVLANDITEKINYIKAIESQNQKLLDIAWTQSHVVRAPLARIMGLVHLISSQNCLDKETAELFQHLLHSAYDMDEIIRGIVTKTDGVELKMNGK
ncbi:MAG: histidine kinase [Thalassobius sp.]|nr:histidine kinase [Thalassovita sp.]